MELVLTAHIFPGANAPKALKAFVVREKLIDANISPVSTTELALMELPLQHANAKADLKARIARKRSTGVNILHVSTTEVV